MHRGAITWGLRGSSFITSWGLANRPGFDFAVFEYGFCLWRGGLFLPSWPLSMLSSNGVDLSPRFPRISFPPTIPRWACRWLVQRCLFTGCGGHGNANVPRITLRAKAIRAGSWAQAFVDSSPHVISLLRYSRCRRRVAGGLVWDIRVNTTATCAFDRYSGGGGDFSGFPGKSPYLRGGAWPDDWFGRLRPTVRSVCHGSWTPAPHLGCSGPVCVRAEGAPCRCGLWALLLFLRR